MSDRTIDEFTSGAKGTVIINNSAEYKRKLYSLIVLEDTTFTSIKDKNGNDIKDQLITDTGTAIKAGAIIRPNSENYFSAVTVATGSVVGVL